MWEIPSTQDELILPTQVANLARGFSHIIKRHLVQTKEDCFQAVSPDQMGLRILHQVKIACPVILNSTGFPNYIVTTIAPFEAQFKTHFSWTLLVC